MGDRNFIQRPTGMDEDPGIVDGNVRREEVNLDGGVFAIGANHPPSPVINEVDASVEQLLEEINTEPEHVPEPVDATLQPITATNRRPNRVSYSKKKLIGTKTLFISPEHLPLYSEIDTWVLKGRIDECPNKKKNGNTFFVNWDLHSSVPALPSDFNVGHVRNRYENTVEMKKTLKEAIDLHESTVVDPEENTATATVNVETPAVSRRYQAVASMRTAASSSSSTVDSDRVTRNNSNTIESDSDTEGSDRVDESDPSWEVVDETDDFYPSFFYENETEEGDSDDDSVLQGNVGPECYSRLLKDVQWSFSQVKQGLDLNVPTREMYNGPTGLRRGVAHSFRNPFDCLKICGGFTYEYIATLAANTNDYFDHHIRPNKNPSRWHGMVWRPITTEEMYKFLGIILKISIVNMDSGGYESYFRNGPKKLSTGVGDDSEYITIEDTEGWAWKYMSLKRFKQIRGAFHPEDKSASLGGDKCYQLRRAINQINLASKKTFHAGANMTFDEGGVACRSRLCPVRQYNKDKPDKFRVDFFILSDSINYNILHIDVYQGKNATNSYIDYRCHSLPTTQKAVVNSLIASGLHSSPHGSRHIFLDNRYQCPELAILLREQFNMYSTGTTRQNRKGWNKETMNLKKTDGRGTMKFAFDEVTKILTLQWCDSKVVNCVTSLIDTKVGIVQRQIGPTRTPVSCPEALIKYQKNMFGVDKGDQIRVAGGGFATKSHFKKWYKRILFGIFDCMLLNGLVSWNLSAETVSYRKKMKRYEFQMWIAQSFLSFKDDATPRTPTQVRDGVSDTPHTVIDAIAERRKHKAVTSGKHATCIVCSLESSIAPNGVGRAWLKRSIAKCCECGLTVHNFCMMAPNRLLQKYDKFKGMTCFEIIHSDIGKEIWVLKQDGSMPGKKRYIVDNEHPIVKRLKEEWNGPSATES